MKHLRTALAALLIGIALPTLADPITGRASVIDGDTIEIQGVKLRLHGIDAPESRQTCRDASGTEYRCGQKAAFALDGHIGTQPVTCEGRETDRYGRTIAVCYLGREDLNAWMVLEGHAVAFRRYSHDYDGEEALARTAKRGIWAGEFQEPSEWRRAQRQPKN